MSVPDFQSFLKPLLEIAADGEEHSMKDARERIAKSMRLSAEDVSELLPSGVQTKFDNRVYWAKIYLVRAGVFSSPRRGYFRITDRGRELHRQRHDRIDITVLNQFPEFVAFHTPSRSSTPGGMTPVEVSVSTTTPEEALQHAYQSMRNDLISEILARVKGNSPRFFEALVVDLMVAMGYGGARAGQEAS